MDDFNPYLPSYTKKWCGLLDLEKTWSKMLEAVFVRGIVMDIAIPCLQKPLTISL